MTISGGYVQTRAGSSRTRSSRAERSGGRVIVGVTRRERARVYLLAPSEARRENASDQFVNVAAAALRSSDGRRPVVGSERFSRTDTRKSCPRVRHVSRRARLRNRFEEGHTALEQTTTSWSNRTTVDSQFDFWFQIRARDEYDTFRF